MERSALPNEPPNAPNALRLTLPMASKKKEQPQKKKRKRKKNPSILFQTAGQRPPTKLKLLLKRTHGMMPPLA